MSIKSLFENIADAIKEKNPNIANVTPVEMPSAIRSIPSGSSTAGGVTYDNTASGLTANNVQDAIDELAEDVSTINSDLSELEEKIVAYETVNWPTNSISKSYDISQYDRLHVIIVYTIPSEPYITFSIDLGTWNSRIMEIETNVMRNFRGGYYYSATNYVGVAAQLTPDRMEASIVSIGSDVSITNWGIYVLGTKK